MKKSSVLKQERAQKIKAQKEATALASTENRSLNTEETTAFRTIQADIDDLTGQIEIAELAEANQRSLEGSTSTDFKPEGEEQRGDKKPVFSLHRAIRSQMVNGDMKLEGAELEMHQRASKRGEALGIAVAGFALETRATSQTVTGDSGANGGNLVATDLQSPIDFLRPEPLMKKLGAVYQSGLTGNLRYPKNAGGIVASWEGETDTADPSANAYGYVDSIPKRLAVTVPISLQNLMQSSIDLEAYTAKEINAAIENAIDKAAVNGSGTGEPMGVLNVSGTNSVATGTDGSAPTWANIVDMETGIFVANASAAKMSYIVNPQTRGKLKKTKHEAGDLGYIMDKSGEINGYPSVTSNHVPSNLTKGTGTGLSAAAFGDWTQLLINQWGYMDFSVDEFSRKKDGFIEITVNVFLDVLVKQPKAFSVVKGLITT